MKIEEIEETIVVKKYRCSDGRVFDEYSNAEIYQGMMDGDIKKCNICEGTGKVPNEDFRNYYTCNKCNGSGYLRRQVEWKSYV